jgi:hypothetical protein
VEANSDFQSPLLPLSPVRNISSGKSIKMDADLVIVNR